MSTETTIAATSAAPAIRNEAVTPPRTRWAAIVWGLLFAVVAAMSLWFISDDDRRAGISDWALTLTPATISTLVILTIGVLMLVTGASALLRRVQRRAAVSAPQGPSDDSSAE